MTRGLFLVLICCSATGAEPPRLVSKELFVAASDPSAAVWVKSCYTQAEGLDMMCIRSTESHDDVYNNWEQRFSSNNGQSWSDWEPMPGVPGMRLSQRQPGWVDPSNGWLLQMEMIGNESWYTDGTLRYRVSTDGGRSYDVDQPVIQSGGQYDAANPIEGVTVGQNALQIAATTFGPLRTSQGSVLVPGSIVWPGDYSEVVVFIGDWNADKTITWDISHRVAVDRTTQSTIGLTEPTIAEMPDGRLLMVMRAGNSGETHIPGYKWQSVSDDGGRTWSNPIPWTYADGANFFSPSSCSQILRHSNGNYYWLGNISPDNTNGNSPRHPLVIGQIDPESFLLIKDTVSVIDTVGPDDPQSLQLSNFAAYEDRASGEIVVHVTRYVPSANPPHWTGNAYIYCVSVVPVPEPPARAGIRSRRAGRSEGSTSAPPRLQVR